MVGFSGRSTILLRRRRKVFTVASSPGMPAIDGVAGFGVGLLAHDDVVAVEDAGLDHGVAAHAQHEEHAVAGEVFRDGERLLDVLRREHAGAGGDVADERHVADGAALDRSRPTRRRGAPRARGAWWGRG